MTENIDVAVGEKLCPPLCQGFGKGIPLLFKCSKTKLHDDTALSKTMTQPCVKKRCRNFLDQLSQGLQNAV